MDSRALPSPEQSPQAHIVPRWAQPSSAMESEADAAFMAGAALNALDNLLRAEPAWAGLLRDRLALKCAVAGVRLSGRNEEEAELRDALLLRAPGDDPGPAGNIYLAFKTLTSRNPSISDALLRELADQFELRWDDALAALPDTVEELLKTNRAAPFFAVEIVNRIMSARPDAELLAWWMADWMLAKGLRWERPVPLLMAQRYGPAFRTGGGRGRVVPGEPPFAVAVCAALVHGAADALRLAGEIERRVAHLLEVAPKVRTKGAEPVIHALLEQDAVSASAPGAQLSRWASRRLFERLEAFAAVRELSGRSTFRIYGV